MYQKLFQALKELTDAGNLRWIRNDESGTGVITAQLNLSVKYKSRPPVVAVNSNPQTMPASSELASAVIEQILKHEEKLLEDELAKIKTEADKDAKDARVRSGKVTESLKGSS
jgi:hypothetical protein